MSLTRCWFEILLRRSDSGSVRGRHFRACITARLGCLLLALTFSCSSGCVYFRPDGTPPDNFASYWWDDIQGPDNGAPGDWQNYDD